MTDYIKREYARGKLCSMCRWEGTENCGACEHPIDDIPAADVAPVVRCEDCVHYDKGENDSESWMYCKVLAKDVYDDFYCELGERREAPNG